MTSERMIGATDNQSNILSSEVLVVVMVVIVVIVRNTTNLSQNTFEKILDNSKLLLLAIATSLIAV